MKKLLVLMAILLMAGCVGLLMAGCVGPGPDRTGMATACTAEQSAAVIQFIKSSLLDANNKSDEEMEDVIRQLEKTGRRNLCGRQLVVLKRKGHDIDYERTAVTPGTNYYWNKYE